MDFNFFISHFKTSLLPIYLKKNEITPKCKISLYYLLMLLFANCNPHTCHIRTFRRTYTYKSCKLKILFVSKP